MWKQFLGLALLALTGCATTSTLYYHPAQDAVPTVPARLALDPGFTHTASLELASGTGFNQGRKDAWDPEPSRFEDGNLVDSVELADDMGRVSVQYQAGFRGSRWFVQAGVAASRGTYTTQYLPGRDRYSVYAMQVPVLLGLTSLPSSNVGVQLGVGAMYRTEWGRYSDFQGVFERSPRQFNQVVTRVADDPWSALVVFGVNRKTAEHTDLQSNVWYVEHVGWGLQLNVRHRNWFGTASVFVITRNTESGHTPTSATLGGGVILPYRRMQGPDR